MVSAVNAQNTTAASTSTSIVLSHNVASVIEDVDTEDVARNMAMSLEEVSPEAAPVMSVALNKGFTKVVAAVIEDVNTEDAARSMAMSLEEVNPEAAEVNIARNYIAGEKETVKY